MASICFLLWSPPGGPTPRIPRSSGIGELNACSDLCLPSSNAARMKPHTKKHHWLWIRRVLSEMYVLIVLRYFRVFLPSSPQFHSSTTPTLLADGQNETLDATIIKIIIFPQMCYVKHGFWWYLLLGRLKPRPYAIPIHPGLPSCTLNRTNSLLKKFVLLYIPCLILSHAHG